MVNQVGAWVSEKYAYILLTNEKWWSRRRDQNKVGKTLQAFVRRGTVGPKNAELVLFYVTYPSKEIRVSVYFSAFPYNFTCVF